MIQGKLLRPLPIPSRFLGKPRIARLYLPPSYDAAPSRRYPVLYVHDGQNIFNSAGMDCCFGWGSWALNKTVDALIASHQMEEIIVVGLDNSAHRYLEYRGPAYPYTKEQLAALSRKPPAAGDDTVFHNYSRFLIEELKPTIDREFRTLTDAGHTGILGASLGGIASLAIAWQNPRTLGLAASLSGSIQIERRHFLQNIVGTYRGNKKPIRIYLDSGVADYTGDDDGRRHTSAFAEELRRIGWRDGIDLVHFVDDYRLSDEEMAHAGLPASKWAEAHRGQHNEFYWRLRVWRALVFLFPVSERKSR